MVVSLNTTASAERKIMGPQTEAADQIHAMKHRGERETFRDAVNRVSLALADDDMHYHRLREVIGSMRFSPAGRIWAGAGSAKNVTLANCFMSGIITDSYTDDEGCIMQRAWEAAKTMRMGGGIGYDFSTLRPRGALIKKLMSYSSGPVSFMRIFNEVCLATASAGQRRGAQMAVMRVDHPDIVEFIDAKHDNTSLTGFNISIGATDEFMEAVNTGRPFALRFKGETYQEIDARDLWERIMRSTWDFAEPGILFIDTINRMNNLYYCETISSTNPCSEQPLPPFGSCILGSINLAKYVHRSPVSVDDVRTGVPWATGCSLDLEQMEDDIAVIVPAMDNVMERSSFPLAEQRLEAITKRRMGIGVMGVANALESLGLPYASPEYLNKQDEVLCRLTRSCYKASALRAKEKGPFTLYDEEKYNKSKFILSDALDDETRALIKRYGIRNSHLTSIAPTGTISLAADNVSSGIEPVFAYSVPRPVNAPGGQVIVDVEDYGVRFLGVRGRRAHEVPLNDHLAIVARAQTYVDSSISKTCNTDGNVPWTIFKGLYSRAWEVGVKGLSTFNSDGKRAALLSSKDEEGAACRIDPVTGNRECG
jgi:ribonucleoside-diphosphate reductase alpha chain